MADDPWFRPKSIGYGAGLPLNWKGWAFLALMIVVIGAVPFVLQLFLPLSVLPWVAIAAIAIVTIPFAWISARKTDGGWRWRD